MEKRNENEFLSILKSNLFGILFFLGIAGMMVLGFQSTAGKRKEQAIQSATDSIRRVIITCYAIEGSYPESFDYIKDNYEIYIDEEEFSVFYTVYGSNVMPKFRIVEKG